MSSKSSPSFSCLPPASFPPPLCALFGSGVLPYPLCGDYACCFFPCVTGPARNARTEMACVVSAMDGEVLLSLAWPPSLRGCPSMQSHECAAPPAALEAHPQSTICCVGIIHTWANFCAELLLKKCQLRSSRYLRALVLHLGAGQLPKMRQLQVSSTC